MVIGSRGLVRNVALPLLFLLFVLGACVQPSGQVADTSVPTEEPPQPVTVTVALVADPGTMNPITASSTAEVIMTRILFDGLTALDPDTFAPQPHLAASWETSEDGLVWTFHLRQDVKWHDGVDFTAEDVVFTFEKLLDPEINSARGRHFDNVNDVVATDDYTLEIHVDEPWAALPTYLANRFQVAPKHLLEGKDIMTFAEFNKTNPVGTGPFKMQRYEAANYIEVAANQDYFEGAPHVDTIFLKVLPDANAQIAQLKTGELDFVLLAPAHLRAVQNTPDIWIKSGVKSRWWAFHVNNSHELFSDERVRQAISYAIDRQLIIDSVLLGHGVIGTGPIIPALEPYYNPDVTTYPYDLEQARALLQEAGWTDSDDDGIVDKDGEPFRFEISTIQGITTIEKASTIIQQNLKAIGLDPYLKGYEFSSFITEVRDNREGPDMFESYFVWMTPEPEPDGIYPYFHSSNAIQGSDFTVYRNDRVDELLEEGRRLTDVEERVPVYHEIQEILAEEVPRIFIAYPDEIYAIRQRLRGIHVSDPWAYTHEWEVVGGN